MTKDVKPPQETHGPNNPGFLFIMECNIIKKMEIQYDLQIQGLGGKKILVIGCVHGDELIGQKVITELRKLEVSEGTLITILANKRAMKAGKRFLEQDLNRSFPGKKEGNYEERLAYELLPIIQEADIVLDIHSTTTDTTSAIILTKVNKSIKQLLLTFKPQRVVIMEKGVGKTALTGYCKAGISFEYGKEKSRQAYLDTLNDIKKIIAHYGLIKNFHSEKKILKPRTEYYEVLRTLERFSGFKLEKTIKNFVLVKKNSVIAKKKTEVQKAPHDFYPLLFGPISYKEIWGFMAKKKKEI